MYKTLYRKYRPDTFDTIIGQDIIKKALQNTISQKKISHAYLFSGKSGTGKTTLAKIYAKAINCLVDNENVPCGTCKSCDLISKNQSIDIVELDAASNNGVEHIKKIIDATQYPPIVCKYKVYIIDEVHMLTNASFNALLKTLEEPPTNTIFILATTEEYKIPETILTRCQRYVFYKVKAQEIDELLQKILINEKKDFDMQATSLIATMADGSVRQALSIMEQCMHSEKKLTTNLVNDVHGLLSTSELIEFVNAIFESNQIIINKILSYINKTTFNYEQILNDILLLFNEKLVYKFREEKFGMKFAKQIKEKSIIIDNDFIFAAIEILKKTLAEIKYSSNIKLSFEIAIFELANISKKAKSEHKETIFQANQKIINESKKLKQPIKKPELNNKNKKIKAKDFELQHYNDPQEYLQKDSDKVLNTAKKTKVNDLQKDQILRELEEEQKQIIEQNQFVVDKNNLGRSTILNVLVSAIKAQRENISKKLTKVQNLPRTNENSKWISMFSGAKVVAASNEAVILCFDFEPSAVSINFSSSSNDFIKFVLENFDKEYLFIGTWKTAWKKEIENYKILKEKNELPKFKPFKIPKYIPKDVVEKKEVQEAKKLFGDLLEIEGGG